MPRTRALFCAVLLALSSLVASPALAQIPEAVPSALDFGAAPVDLVEARPVRIYNPGPNALVVHGASAATAAFENDPASSDSITAGHYVDLVVRALRPVLGVTEDTLSVLTSSPELPILRVPLRAEGIAGSPAVPALADSALVFPLAVQGVPVSLALTVLNLGETTFHVTGASFDGAEFSVSETFPLAVTPLASRTLTVVCSHATLGPVEDTLRLATDDPGTPFLLVPLSATTRLPQPIIQHDSSIVVPPGPLATPGTGGAWVYNLGELDLVLSSPQLGTTEFEVIGPYPRTLPPGGIQFLPVRHLRSVYGQSLDTLRVTTNVPGLPQIAIPVSGYAFVGNPIPTWPASLDFGTGMLGESEVMTAMIGNSGDATYTVESADVTFSEFTLLTPLPFEVSPGIPVPLEVRFDRTIAGTFNGQLVLHTTSPVNPVIQLYGETRVPFPLATLLADSLDFGELPIGVVVESSASIRSIGVGPVTVTGIAVASPDVTVLTAVPLVIEENTTATIRFRYAPSAPGTLSEAAQIVTDMSGDSILVLALTGLARRPPVVDVDPGIVAPVELAVGATTSVPLQVLNLGDEWPLGGTATVTVDSVLSPPAGPPIVGDPVQLRIDGEGHVWDVQPDGSIATGDSAAFAGGLDWIGFPALGSTTLRDGGRTIQLGPTVVSTRDFTRWVHVPVSGAWIRYFDTVHNRTAAPMEFRVIVNSRLAPSSAGIARTSSGGTALNPLVDDWAANADEAGPAIAHVFAGAGAQRPSTATLTSGAVNYDYLLQLAPGASASILHFALQAPTLSDAMQRAEVLRTPAADALAGLSALERSRIVNFPVSRAIAMPATPFVIDPLGSLGIEVDFDAGAISDEQRVYGTLRVATNDLVTPLFVVPLELRILGTPDVVDVGPDGPTLVLAARFLPNPASGRSVRLSYALPVAGDARFDLFDVRGRCIATRTIEGAPAGRGSLDWSGGGGAGLLAPGVYWTRLTHAGKSVITKGVVLK